MDPNFNCPPGYKGTYLPALKKPIQTDTQRDTKNKNWKAVNILIHPDSLKSMNEYELFQSVAMAACSKLITADQTSVKVSFALPVSVKLND